MFFRILALLLLVSLVTANSLVGRGDVVDVCDAISNMTTTANDMQNACTAFEANSTKDMAARILIVGVSFRGEIVSATNVCPTDVLSSDDTLILINILGDFVVNSVQPLLNFLLNLRSAIGGVGFAGQFCFAVEAIITSTNTFMDKVSSCSASAYQNQLAEMRQEVVTMMASVQVSYCGTISPNGSSEVSGVDI